MSGCDTPSTQQIIPSGAPAARAAASMMRAASFEHCIADGCGQKMIVLRVFAIIRHLKSTVEVGLVIGVTPRMTPIGSAISLRLRSGYSRMTPTVRSSLIEW